MVNLCMLNIHIQEKFCFSVEENVTTRHVISWTNSKNQTFRNTKNRDIQKYRDVVTINTGIS